MKDRKIYLSSGAFLEGSLAEVLDAAGAHSLNRIELSSGLPHEAGSVELARRRAADFDFLIHNYFPAPAEPFVLNLASADEDSLQKSRDHCRRAIELTAELGAPFYAAHAGFAAKVAVEHLGRPFDDSGVVPRDAAYEIFRESVVDILDHADRHGVGFLIENNVVAPFNAPDGRNDMLLLCDPDELITFHDEIDHPGFGYLMDVGHLNVSAATLGFDRADAMDRLAPYIRAFHLSDNDSTADTNEPFDEKAWFLPWLRLCPDAPIVIEAYSLTLETMGQCVDVVNKSIQDSLPND